MGHFFKTTFNYTSEVLDRLTQSLGKELKEMTIFILVDSLQQFPHEKKSKDTKLYSALATIANLVNSHPSFGIWVLCCNNSDPF